MQALSICDVLIMFFFSPRLKLMCRYRYYLCTVRCSLLSNNGPFGVVVVVVINGDDDDDDDVDGVWNIFPVNSQKSLPSSFVL